MTKRSSSPASSRALAVSRVARGLMAVLADAQEPPREFVADVLRALPARPSRPPAVDPWRSTWGLIPAFAALVVGLFFLWQVSPDPAGPTLLPANDLSPSEHLVLDTAPPGPDRFMAALLDGDLP